MSRPGIPARLQRLLVVIGTLLCVSPAWSAELTVSAAASLTDSFREIAAAFQQKHPSTTVRLNFAASGTLLQQIARGAPVDVFASADLATMDKAQSEHLIVAAQRRNFAQNTLVLIVPTVGDANLAKLEDLRQASVRRVAVGNPDSVPVGRYTKRALERAGLWAPLEEKRINAQSVRQVLDYVARGEVEAGFVYATDAAIMRDRVRVVPTVPLEEPVTYPIAPIAAASDPAMAQVFVDFVTGAQAQEILARYGFSNP